MRGKIRISQDHFHLEVSNQIHTDLVEYLISRTNSFSDQGLLDYFTAVQEIGGDNTGKSGIVVNTAAGWRSVPTSGATPSNSSARRWRALWTPEETTIITGLQLGHDLKATEQAEMFNTMYGSVVFGDPQTYVTARPISFEWEINLNRA